MTMNYDGTMIVSAVLDGNIFVGSDNASVVIGSPTTYPSSQSFSNSAEEAGIYSNKITVGSFLICVPGIIVIVNRCAMLATRLWVGKEGLNELSNVYWEAFESAFRAMNIMLSFNSLIVAYINDAHRATALLLLSRMVIAAVWAFFVVILVIPSNQTCFSVSNLSLYLNSKAIQNKIQLKILGMKLSFSVRFVAVGCMVAGIFDITIFRLLPWTASEFTSAVQGYPNMFTVRCCLYGTLASTLLQSASSIASLAEAINVESLLFLFVSLFNTVLSLLGVILFMQMANSNSLQVSIVVSKKSDKDVDIEMQDISIKEEEVKTEEVVNPIFIENTSAEVVEVDNKTVEVPVVVVEEKPVEEKKGPKYEEFVYEEPEELADCEVDSRGIGVTLL